MRIAGVYRTAELFLIERMALKGTKSIATKVALVVSGVVVGGLTVVGLLAWRQTDAEALDLELHEANARLSANVRMAYALLDQRFPGRWHLVPVAEGEPPLEYYNGNGRKSEYEAQERLAQDLYKGDTRIRGN